jgi:hypothetical protein
MFIRCESDNGSDRFYLPNFNELDELKEYAENNMPIKCYLLNTRHCYSIFLSDEMTPIYLYLNNFLYYREIYNLYLMTTKEYNNLYLEQCQYCHLKNYDFGLQCIYEKDDDLKCINFKKEFSFIEWIKNKLSIN